MADNKYNVDDYILIERESAEDPCKGCIFSRIEKVDNCILINSEYDPFPECVGYIFKLKLTYNLNNL